MSDDDRARVTEAAWRELSGALRGWLARHAPRGVDPEELLQETFLRIHAGVAGLTDEDRLAPWVWRVARNVLYDALRGREAGEQAADTIAVAVPDDGEGDAGAASEVASWLAEFLAGLDGSDSEVLRLADLEGLSHKQLAGRLGLSLTATKSRVLRARQRLREALLACCHFEFDRRGAVVDWRRRGIACRDCP